MPNLNLTHRGNMNITSASLTSAGTLDVRYEPNNTGAVTGFTFTPPEGSEFVCGETYTITAIPKFSGNVLTETFTVSGVDIAGVLRSDNSVLRQGYDSDLTHYELNLASVGATIISSSVTSTYLELEISIDNDEYAEIDIQAGSGDVIVYHIDNITGGDVPIVLATSVTIVVDSAITDNGFATSTYSPDNATVQMTYSSSDPDLATIDPNTGEITVLADGEVEFCVTDSVSNLSDCKTVTVEKSEEPGTSGITALTLSVAEEIVETGIAVPIYSPADEEVSFVFTSSNPSLATIDSGGSITVLGNGEVTFCVRDEISGLEDCKTVIVRKAVYIDDIEIVVADEIIMTGVATATYTPTAATVSLVYSSSNPSIATIDPITGEITVNRTGNVTFCVRDIYTNLTDCKNVSVTGMEGLVEIVYNVTSTQGTLLFTNYNDCPCHRDGFTSVIYYNGERINAENYYSFPETGEQTIYVDFLKTTGSTAGYNYLCNHIFAYNSNIVKITFPETYDLQATGNHCFIGCSNLREADLSCFKELDIYAFESCSSLTSVTIPNAEAIGDSAFEYCTSLPGIDGPKAEFLGCYSFGHTTSLTYANFPVLETIDINAFQYSGIENFTVASSVTTLKNGVFDNCTKLRNLTFENSTPPSGIDSRTFWNTGSIDYFFNIWVPCNAVTTYKNWLPNDSLRAKVRCVGGTNTVVITATYNLDASSYLANSRQLVTKDVVDDGTWGSIYISYAGATGGTNSIISITDDEHRDIGVMAPTGVSGYYTVYITIDIDSANNYGIGPMFAQTSLYSIIIPEELNNFGPCMFVRCEMLTGVTIPEAVTEIKYLCFYGCSSLVDIHSYNTTAPTLDVFTRTQSSTFSPTPFYGVGRNGILYYPSGSNYSTWLQTSSSKPQYYLGYYGWTGSPTL